MTVETEVKEVVAEVKAEAEKVATAVTAEVAKVEAEVKPAVKPAVEHLLQELTAEEKLAIREIENEYLKAQIEINRLSVITQNAQKNFSTVVETLKNKYVIDPAEWVFDNIALVFKKTPTVAAPPVTPAAK